MIFCNIFQWLLSSAKHCVNIFESTCPSVEPCCTLWTLFNWLTNIIKSPYIQHKPHKDAISIKVSCKGGVEHAREIRSILINCPNLTETFLLNWKVIPKYLSGLESICFHLQGRHQPIKNHGKTFQFLKWNLWNRLLVQHIFAMLILEVL